MEYTQETKAVLWLCLAQNVNVLAKKKIYQAVDSVEELYRNFLDYRDLIVSIAGESCFDKLLKLYDNTLIDKYISVLNTANVGFLPITDDDYPSRLYEIEDSPLGLFYMGDIALMSSAQTIAVVGSRNSTRYGRDVTRKLTTELAGHGIVIVSGLARGVDSIAHTSCLEVGGKTIAVLGNGIDVVYPAENRELYRKIADNGLIISEYPLQVPPAPYNFPQRNRIISALSDGLLITEASRKSGTMLTADCAIDQGKEIFCVPGPIFTESSEGTNYLLLNRDHVMVLTAEDILNRYDITIKNAEPSCLQLDFTEQGIVDSIKNEPKHFDELMQISGLSVNNLQALLIGLELQGVISKQPGNFWGKSI